MPRKSRRETFEGAQGANLAGILDLPATPTRAFALFAHCFTCSKDLKAVAWISRTLVEKGIAVLRF
ncbi:MAG: osmotically inducible protein C, partial [Acidobacteria bacterium]|nr:osmotically inducible protein C [Acidobacteriota bacterium]